MANKSEDFSMEKAMRLAKSNAGQQLFQAMQAQDGASLSQAMADAQNGDYKMVRQRLSAMMESPQIKELLKQLQGEHYG